MDTNVLIVILAAGAAFIAVNKISHLSVRTYYPHASPSARRNYADLAGLAMLCIALAIGYESFSHDWQKTVLIGSSLVGAASLIGLIFAQVKLGKPA